MNANVTRKFYPERRAFAALDPLVLKAHARRWGRPKPVSWPCDPAVFESIALDVERCEDRIDVEGVEVRNVYGDRFAVDLEIKIEPDDSIDLGFHFSEIEFAKNERERVIGLLPPSRRGGLREPPATVVLPRTRREPSDRHDDRGSYNVVDAGECFRQCYDLRLGKHARWERAKALTLQATNAFFRFASGDAGGAFYASIVIRRDGEELHRDGIGFAKQDDTDDADEYAAGVVSDLVQEAICHVAKDLNGPAELAGLKRTIEAFAAALPERDRASFAEASAPLHAWEPGRDSRRRSLIGETLRIAGLAVPACPNWGDLDGLIAFDATGRASICEGETLPLRALRSEVLRNDRLGELAAHRRADFGEG